jgi:tripartite-type tricarboxylate transporter receptor subunit TctC
MACFAHLRRSLAGRAAIATALAYLHGVPALGQSPADFYRDKQISFIVSSSAGGGFDTYTRLIARHMQAHMPGRPLVIVQNMPGAGGVRAANFLYSVAPKDGTAIGLFQNTIPFEPLYGNKQALFDATRLSWLGSPGAEFAVFAIWHTVPVDRIEDARTHELVVGAPGSNSSPAFYGRVFETVFNIRIKIIAGYPGASEVLLGTERRENDGNSSAYWSSLKAIRPEWIAERKLKFLLQYGPHPHPELKGVPYALDMVSDPTLHELMEVAAAPLSFGRPIAAPPGVPRDRIAALRAALAETFTDPDYLADCAALRLECHSPVSASQITDGVTRAYGASPEVIAKLRQIYRAGGT